MLQKLISLSPDLKRLQDEGYCIEVIGNHLLVHEIPYVNSRVEIKYGILISELTLAGDVTTTPKTHIALFSGEHPCNKDGSEISGIKHQSTRTQLGPNLFADHSFSNKPKEGYPNFYEKIVRYATIISNPAQSLNPEVTPRPFKVIEAKDSDSRFKYIDTSSSRSGINMLSKKLEAGKIGIIGLGGTGSYILDLIAKTPVEEIVLFDGDKFSQHNAFRSPGAPSVEELKKEPLKVVYFREKYSNIHRHIKAVPEFINPSNFNCLAGLNFVFICIDNGEAKKLIIDKLLELDIDFVDVGMGIQLVNNALTGMIRVTASTSRKRDHIVGNKRISFSDGGIDNLYTKNIQIADLNLINAGFAVIWWKKLMGFYLNLENEFHSVYTIDGNCIFNEDRI